MRIGQRRQATLDEVAEALTYLDVDDRQEWLDAAMAVKSEFGDGGFDVWDNWSQASDRYNERDALSVWRSVREHGGITLGTLFYKAKMAGWERRRQDDWHRPAAPPRPKPPPAPDPKVVQLDDERRRRLARAIWARVNNDRGRDPQYVAGHLYCLNKGIEGDGGAARGRVKGKKVGDNADCIVVPIRSLQTGEVVAVECINSAGAKQSFGPKSEGVLVLGNDRDKTLPWYVVEGWASGYSAAFHWHAGNACAVVAFGKGRMDAVAKQVIDHYAPHKLVVLHEPEVTK